MLQIQNLNKRFNDINAINNISFNVKDGHILGLIGQNGAGKSTTFHSILNFISYDGYITWNGNTINKDTFNEIGYLPEERSLINDLTIQNQLTYFAKLKNRSKTWTIKRITNWMDDFKVKGKLTDKISTLSKGNQQKIQLIATLIHEPKLIILDEPFSGLDPVNADLLKNSILREKQKGATIIFSSHNMKNVEELCDELVMLNHGNIVLNGSIADIRDDFGKDEIYVTTKLSQFELSKLPGVIDVKIRNHNKYKLKITDQKFGPEIFNEISHGKYIEEFSQQPPSLEEIFRKKAGAYIG